ncbi:mechanosensitive ion channel family protein [Oceanibacterium hippocampi]|uniref:Miniconductance mechanosensitive channel MscM n=1 Tax=Oceanibacterium hippocampi TaxID=745714 RepID=A0A1Y5S1M3_9PROT|nr:mechanosensitive ion channel domain-containing protein [Oceanibacterium hippocampi]SLN30552.1 Miniconductance mechanosensitive channel MscM precursor [Oceanibacterium hippocampi]
MDRETDFLAGFETLRALVSEFLAAVLQPWTGIQFAVIAAILVLGLFVGARIERRLEPRLREIRGKPRLLRVLAILLRRMPWFATTILLWLTVAAMREVTWPSRSYFITVAAMLATAWLVITVASRVIRNRLLARVVAAIVWAIVALEITGSLDATLRLLDAVGFDLGEGRISLLAALKATVLFGLLFWGAVALGHLVETLLNRSADLTPRIQVLLSKTVKSLLLVLAGLTALTTLGIDLTALTVFSGAVGVGVGFGLQKVVSNYISGIIILLDKSIKPGDTISLGETFGWIRSLQARFVSVVTRDGKEYLIPNEDLITGQVVNWSFSDTLIRLDVEFGVSYDSDPHEVTRLAIEAAKTVDRVQSSTTPVCWMTGFGESSLDFVLRFWIADPQRGLTNIRGQVLLACWDAFKAAGIAIPFPHREIIMRTPVEIRRARDNGEDGGVPPKD